MLEVFKPKPGTGTVDKSKPFGVYNMIPCEHDSPALLPKQAALFHHKNVVFMITRSKNDNTVVYSAKIHDHKLDEAEPIDVYWMGFSRKDPNETDEAKLRSDLSWLEKKMAYGATGHRLDAHLIHSAQSDFEVHLVAVPHLKPRLKLDEATPRLRGLIGGRMCQYLRVYVLAHENMFGLPKVAWVNIHGIDLETGEEIVEKITP